MDPSGRPVVVRLAAGIGSGAPGYAGNTCAGFYDVHGTRVHFTTVTRYPSGECAPPSWLADWRATPSGLVMDVAVGDTAPGFLFGSKEWVRIGS